MKTFALILSLACCTTADDLPLGQTLTRDCGAAPLAPGWSVAFDGDRVIMPVPDYDAIKAWRAAVEDWQQCASTHP